MSEKYPRTPHLPWSPGCARDDKQLLSVAPLLGRELVITEKMDGSNVCLEREHVFARSHAAAPRHPSFDALKAVHAALRWQIPDTWQVFGEWLWARHSLSYDRLPAFLLVFGIRDSTSESRWLAWDETTAWCNSQGLHTVPLLWRGAVSTETALRAQTEALTQSRSCGEEQEGVVVRLAESFPDTEFALSVAKWVRPSHVQTDDHWTELQIIPNRLALGQTGEGVEVPRGTQ
jgi:hypothetical protein